MKETNYFSSDDLVGDSSYFDSWQGKQGPIEHIYKGVLFIYDRHHLEHAGFICVKAESCMMVGGSRANGDRNV